MANSYPIELSSLALGNIFREERKKLGGISQEQLADLMHISGDHLGRVECGSENFSFPAFYNFIYITHSSADIILSRALADSGITLTPYVLPQISTTVRIPMKF